MNRSNTNDCRLYVGNLPDDVRERELEDVFYKYGSIKDVELKLPKGRGTPYAFVEFDDPRYEDIYQFMQQGSLGLLSNIHCTKFSC